MKIVATTSLPAVDCLNADRWNAARSRQKYKKCTLSKQRKQGEHNFDKFSKIWKLLFLLQFLSLVSQQPNISLKPFFTQNQQEVILYQLPQIKKIAVAF